MLEGFFPEDVLYHIANAVILFVILRFLVYKPVRKFMRERSERISNTLDQAENARKEIDLLKSEYESRIAKAEESARSRAIEIIGAANEMAQSITENAQSESKEIILKANAAAKAEHDKAIAGLREEVIDLASVMASRILQEHFEHADDIVGGERVE